VDSGGGDGQSGPSWPAGNFEVGDFLMEASDISGDKEKMPWVWLTLRQEKRQTESIRKFALGGQST